MCIGIRPNTAFLAGSGIDLQRGLIVTEPTDVRLKSGRRRNGNLKYTLPSIQEVLRDYYARQRSTLEAQTERQRVQKMLAEQQAEDSL